MEGLVASIGGLDASLCKEASAALVATLQAPPSGGHAQNHNHTLYASLNTPVSMHDPLMSK